MVAPIRMLVSRLWHTCHSSFSWTALLFSSIHSYIKLLHHQIFTCMFPADEGRLSVFQHVNSLAMHLNMSLRFPGPPQSLTDGIVAQKTELKVLIPHTTKVEARNQYRLNVQVHCLFFVYLFFHYLDWSTCVRNGNTKRWVNPFRGWISWVRTTGRQ